MNKVSDWSSYPNFSKKEFDCKETGENEMKAEFMEKLQLLRNRYNKPMTITSGFRSVKHSAERNKAQGGTHTKGIACDIACNGPEAYEIVRLAYLIGFNGIGVSQKSGARFVHLDIDNRKSIWSY